MATAPPTTSGSRSRSARASSGRATFEPASERILRAARRFHLSVSLRCDRAWLMMRPGLRASRRRAAASAIGGGVEASAAIPASVRRGRPASARSAERPRARRRVEDPPGRVEREAGQVEERPGDDHVRRDAEPDEDQRAEGEGVGGEPGSHVSIQVSTCASKP